jgi:hypothetical protein
MVNRRRSSIGRVSATDGCYAFSATRALSLIYLLFGVAVDCVLHNPIAIYIKNLFTNKGNTKAVSE